MYCIKLTQREIRLNIVVTRNLLHLATKVLKGGFCTQQGKPPRRLRRSPWINSSAQWLFGEMWLWRQGIDDSDNPLGALTTFSVYTLPLQWRQQGHCTLPRIHPCCLTLNTLYPQGEHQPPVNQAALEEALTTSNPVRHPCRGRVH